MTERPLYRARINRGGAMLADTKRFLVGWDGELDLKENMQRAVQANIFSKRSREQAQAAMYAIHWRYLGDPEIVCGLVQLARSHRLGDTLALVLYYLAAKGDPVIYDAATEYIQPRYAAGFTEVSTTGMLDQFREWVAAGRSHAVWNDETAERVAIATLTALRDFGVLAGTKLKRITPPFISDQAFALLIYLMQRETRSGEKTLDHPDWRLFFLDRAAVERFLVEAHQHHYLTYAAAGNVVRLDFPADSFEGEVHVVAAGAH